MGVLTDIIIADPEEAVAINAADGNHLQRWECLESKGIDTVKLGTLSQILANRPLDDINAVATFMLDALLDEKSEDGPWVYLVPDQLQRALALLSATEQEPVAAKWAQTEEFELARWQVADVQAYLRELVLHARKAQEAGKSLLVWICL